jgi:acetolactate synthase-1/2/3 large subunit
MLEDGVSTPDPEPYKRAEPHPAAEDMAALRALLAEAKRPLAILGGGGWDAETAQRIETFAVASGLPIAASFRRQDYFNNELPCYAGDAGVGINPNLAQRVKDADLLLAVGARLGEMPSSGIHCSISQGRSRN